MPKETNTYISILRGINVSGQKMIRMDALKNMYEVLAFTDVQTYIQSGNVIFRVGGLSTTELAKRISVCIKDQFGWEVPVWVFRLDEFEKLVAENPFIGDNEKDEAFLHVSFLAGEPILADLGFIQSKQQPDEAFVVSDRAVYLYCPHGYGRTKLNNNFFERTLNVQATTRNWKTTKELLVLARKVAAAD